MNGLIDGGMQDKMPGGMREQPEGMGAEKMEQGAEPAKAQPKYRSKAVEAVPANLRDAFERVVLAGETIMFSKDMQPEIEKSLAGNEPAFRKLAESVVGLIGLVHREAKGKTPPDVILPAAIELLYEAAAFGNESGKLQSTPEDLKQATQYLVVLLLKGQGAKDDQIMQAFSGQGQPEAQPQQPAEQPPQGAADGLQPA